MYGEGIESVILLQTLSIFVVFSFLFSEKETGQVRDEMQITTVSGIRKIPLYQGEIEVKTGRKEVQKKSVYFAPATNMIQREYKILLSGRIFENYEG